MTPKELYVQSRKAGYPREKALERVRQFKTTGKVPEDPTEAYWDALIKQESGGNQKAVSHKGAVGRAQVMPKTAPEAAAMAGLPFDEDKWRNDPVYNEAIGRAYFRKQHEDFGDPRLAAAAYNAGPGAVRKAGGDINKLPAETRKYVPAITGGKKMTPKEKFIQLRQQGYSKEEALAAVKGAQPQAAAPAPSPAPAPAAAQAPQPVPTPSPAPAPAPAAAQPTGMGAYLNKNIEEQFQKGTGLSRFGAGIQGAAGDMLTGARQAYNSLTGDDETLARLKADQQQRADIFKKYDPEGSGFSAADAGKIAADVGTFGALGGARVGGQMAAGALEGAVKPADDMSERAWNAGIGAATGLVGPAISKAHGMWKNMAPIDAAKDFTAKALRQAPGSPVKEAYEGTAERVGTAADDIYKKYKGVLDSAEQAPGLPPVKLTNTAREISQPLGLDDEVVRALSPKALTTINAVQEGAVKTSQIVDPSGRPFQEVAEHSFEDVRSTLRELKNVQNSFRDAQRPGAAKQIERLRETLESDLDEWAKTGADIAKSSLEQARGADNMYRDEVIPAKKLSEALTAPDGKSMENKLDSYLFGGVNATANSGTEIDKLIGAAPEVRDPLRRILASKINVPRGEVASARAYLGGTTAESLLSPQEREYMVKLADALQKNPSFLSVRLPLVDKVLKTMGVGAVKPYGYESLMQGPASQKIINALRSGAIGTEED